MSTQNGEYGPACLPGGRRNPPTDPVQLEAAVPEGGDRRCSGAQRRPRGTRRGSSTRSVCWGRASRTGTDGSGLCCGRGRGSGRTASDRGGCLQLADRLRSDHNRTQRSGSPGPSALVARAAPVVTLGTPVHRARWVGGRHHRFLAAQGWMKCWWVGTFGSCTEQGLTPPIRACMRARPDPLNASLHGKSTLLQPHASSALRSASISARKTTASSGSRFGCLGWARSARSCT